MDLERRFVELRHEGRTLSGVAVHYGSEARILGFREQFQPGAFGDVSGLDVILNRQHDRRMPLARTGGGGLDLLDSAQRLEVRAELPATRDADDVLALIQAGVLRGLSLEFRASKERWNGSLRTIEKAKLFAVGVVDRPAYGDSAVQLAKRHKPAEPRQENPFWI